MNDFFDFNTEKVFTRWSNPTTIRFDGTQSNVGFEILSYNSNSHTYIIKVGVDENTIKGFSPSKPQNLKRNNLGSGPHPHLTWEANTEPDLKEYWLYRKTNNGSFNKIATINKTTTTYTDNSVTFTKPIWGIYTRYEYKLKSVDTQNKQSVYSNSVHYAGNVLELFPEILSEEHIMIKSKIEEIKSYSLQNYPNPFNPTTLINYQIPKEGYSKNFG